MLVGSGNVGADDNKSMLVMLHRKKGMGQDSMDSSSVTDSAAYDATTASIVSDIGINNPISSSSS